MAGKFTTLVDMIDNSLKSFPQNKAFGTKVNGSYQWITYQELAEQINAARGGLASLGVRSGERVAIIANNRVEWAVFCYATYQLGAAFAPMYESQTADDWSHILKDAQPTVLIVSKPELYKKARPLVDQIASIKAVVTLDTQEDRAIGYRQLLETGKTHPAPVVQVSPSALAGLIYTSGTTGKPKGVMLSHANIISNINAIHEVFPFKPEDVSLSFLPWAHSFGQTVELHGMISCGASLGLAENVNTIMDNLGEVKPTLLFSVPRIFNKIYDGLNKKMNAEGGLKKTLFFAGLKNSAKVREAEAAGQGAGLAGMLNPLYDKLVFSKVRERLGGRLKFAFSGGAALSKEVAEFIDRINILVYEGYGLSETSPIMCANYPGARRIGSVGKPVPQVKVVLDYSVGNEEGVGEIINYGPNNMMGYYNMADETAKVMTPDGGFRTGDLGRFDSDGFLYIVGRVKEQYKLENGKYVAPAPLEEKLQLSPFILQAMIYGDNRPFNIAVLVPDFSALLPWCESNGITTANREEVVKHPKVIELLKQQVEQYAADWKSYERPRNLTLLAEEWSIENDMLTPKLSLKRRNVMKKYGQEIEQHFSKG